MQRTYPVISAKQIHFPEIINVEKQAWVQTYPNSKLGITANDIKMRFSNNFKNKRIKEISQEIRNGHEYRIITNKESVIAYSHLLEENKLGDLVEIYVLPEYQDKGIGTTLLQDALNWFNTKIIHLHVATYNLRAIQYYKKFGFAINPNLQQSKDEDWNILPSGIKIPVVIMENIT